MQPPPLSHVVGKLRKAGSLFSRAEYNILCTNKYVFAGKPATRYIINVFICSQPVLFVSTWTARCMRIYFISSVITYGYENMINLVWRFRKLNAADAIIGGYM